MADPLVAAMKLRQAQKADEARRYREEQRVLLESGAGPTTTPISGEQTDPWPIIADAAANDAAAYATKVKEAAVPQIERAARGGSKLLGSMPGFGGDLGPTETNQSDFVHGGMGFGPEGERVKTSGADLNAGMDLAYGSLNTLFSPLAPPMEAALKPALESEGGQQFVQGLDTLGTGIEDLTGITKENQLDSLMWLGVPAAAHYAGKGIKAGAQNMAKRIIDADAAGAFGGARPNTMGRTIREGMDAEPWWMQPTETRVAVPEMRGPEQELKAENVTPLKADWSKQGTELYKNPTMRELRQMSKDAPYTELRFLADRETGDTYFWPSEYAIHADALKSLGFPGELGDRFIHGYTNAATVKLVKGVDELVNYDFGRKGSISQEVRNDPKFWKERWRGKDKRAVSPLDELDGVEQRGPTQELQALTSDGPKKPGPASVGVKVKPGQSLWDVVSGKTFQAGDDALRGNAAFQRQKAGQMSADQAAIIASKKETQRIIDANKAANAKKIDEYASAPNPLKDVDIDQLVPTTKATTSPSVPRRVTVMPEGKMDGRASGAKNVEIVTSPDVRDLQKAAKGGNIYDEARFLVEEDGVIHTWPAEAGWHNDIADFLGITGDKYHGVVTRKEIDAAIKSGAKTLPEIIEFTQQPSWWGPFKKDYGLDQLPEWQAAEKALADSYAPAPKKPFINPFEVADRFKPEQRAAQSPLEELDNTPIAPEKQKDNVQKWLASREDPAMAYLDDQRNAKMPRKKGEKLIEARGYTELQAKRSPVEEFDTPDPRSGEIAAARARADELFSYKKEQPAATKPEAVPEIKAETRRIWLDPERPVLQPKKSGDTISMLANKESGRGKFEASLKEATAKVGKDFAKERENAFTANTDDHITTSSLAAKTNKALEEHIAMTPEQRMVNFAAAEKTLRDKKWEIETRKGKKIKSGLASKKGGVYNFFTANKKLRKNSEGYEGGEPITLPNGQGVESTGLSLSAFYQRKGFNTCPRGQPCKDACLAETSGGNMRYDSPAIFQETKTNAILDYPEASSVVMFENIAAAREIAARRGNVLTVRMNVLSDIDPKVWAPIIKHFDDVLFIDYTKMKYEPIAPNHHYTYSSTGASNEHTTSIYANWDQSKARLDRGDNVAMAFSTKKTWPKWVVDEETGKRYRVVDGVSHDFRVVDLQDGGKEGVIVGLKNMDETSRDMSFNKTGRDGKSAMTWEDDASTTSGGFMVRYNPAKDGDTAYIPIQNSAKRSRLERNKTGPQTQIKIGGEDRTPVQNMKALALEDFDTPGPFAKPRPKRNPPSAYSKLDRKRKDAERKDREQQQQDVADRMYARLNMQERAPRMDKNQPRRTFEQDYPSSDENPFPALQHPDFWAHGKRVEVDIDGFPIDDPNTLIFGRQEVGGVDKGHSPRKIREMAEAMMKAKNPKASFEAPFQPGAREAGKFTFSKGMRTGDVFPEKIVINKAAEPWLQDQTLAHEVGHAIDLMGSNSSKNIKHISASDGSAPLSEVKPAKLHSHTVPYRTDISPKLEAQLRDIYSEVNENFGLDPNLKGLPKSPERTGYPEHFAQAELLAEAFRLYMYDPGYIKARFPEAAAYLRNLARENPEVAKYVRFNEAGAGLAGVMATKFLAEQQQGDR